MFVDECVVRLRAGRGGNGCVSFHREKYVPRGGPDGGDGGNGGSIFLEADRNLATLQDLSVHPTFHADDGKNGGSNRKNGRAAKDLTIRVPVGTEIFLEPQGSGANGPNLIADLVSHGERLPVARGGRGGGGNARFASAKNRLPRFALHGAPGRALRIRLSLKLLSDLAIVGLPNCGKSTLLAALTAARPKIADYPFTTLTPNLGALRSEDGTSIVLADIPGLIEGAHKGRGLGNRFLKHIERARALVVLLDASSDPDADFRLIRDEILRFNPGIWRRPMIVAVNKIDLVRRPPLKKWKERLATDVYAISALKNIRIDALLKGIESLILQADAPKDRPVTVVLGDPAPRIVQDGDAFAILSAEWEELASMLPAGQSDAMLWFQSKLRSSGVLRRLVEAGCTAGGRVIVGPVEFVYEGA
ncbi:MAG: hypothetical protein A3G34_15105 [Candidatus Lindowbacteria bacterium RIFCSPLOWO2_12_FULL_62_27]|nr:MAG: hypothetical protein A3G34_15105 [Candidatus Lindowbacteria bacterium RIFCSPLOWO2_12_FULL_62_27]OGH63855.1 MAG: hypothetical protein A3I06_06085 [Candidatus Lindowbacteria bacterium RIFCSPLOWO2_02_FULL_62_12]